ncbi:hypothetical protein R1W01_03400 [Shimia sp. FJ5]|uniref:hypothetical protein n=1 Tax=uncultured Shimia sp. TaxID=573152 RepID=UPI002607AB56|nr:hypothetical protein [uncultured Shimia sp.]MDV4143861.1 hypothetical protein [Shimia sp. FJ5]
MKALTKSFETKRRPPEVQRLGGETYRNLLDRLHIAVNVMPPDQTEADDAREHGTFLARQDRWDELADLIREADRARRTTDAGQPIADLLSYGGRADVVQAAEHALLHGRAAKGSNFFSGVEALEFVLDEAPDNYPLALIVANMHIDIGWAWRGASATEELRATNREAFHAHFDRASDILDAFCPVDLDSPALAAARCALLPGRHSPELHIIREFEQLVSLDPMNPRHMRALGNYLLPRWYGDFQALDLEARRTAARTYEDWGAAGYTWVWFDALLVDPEGLSIFEPEYFLEGIYDILDACRDQHTANLTAAHLYQCWQTARERYNETGYRPDLPPALRRGFETVVEHHLREVHPMIWGHAEIGFENTARIISHSRLAEKGRETALSAIAMPFLKRLQDGQTVTFGPDGIHHGPS